MSTSLGWSATRIAAAVRDRERTAEQVVSEHLDAISRREAWLHAWAHLDADAALRAARAVDAAAEPGPLAGVPIGVKDIVDVAGMPTANGAAIPVAGPAERDAAAVARLRAAGAVPMGKTVTTEFALFQPGPTVNPHDSGRTPGGSSSGSAAAVGAGTLPLAIGTQTAGSVVRPASFCGIVGAKPTFGVVPRDGVTMVSPSLDTVGMLGSDVASVAVALGVMASDPQGFEPAEPGSQPRIGFCRTFEWDDLDAATRGCLEAGVERLSADVDVVEVAMPEAMRGLVSAQQTIMAVEGADELASVRTRHGDLLSEVLHRFLRAGEGQRWAYDAALAHAETARSGLGTLFSDVEVLLAPAVLGEAPPIDTTGDPLLCRQWTLLGTPTVAVPGLTGPTGLPFGCQTVALPGQDAVALGAAARIEASLAR